MLFNRTNTELLAEFDQRVFGHALAKKCLINLFNRSRIRHHQMFGGTAYDTEELITPSKILLIGDSGTGKTKLVEEAAAMFDVPLLMLNALELTHTSASGGISPDKFRKMCYECCEDWVRRRSAIGYTASLEGAEQLLTVFIDEMDKLGNSSGSTDSSWNRCTQEHFLSMFDDHFEWAGVSFIFAGAFVGLEYDKPAKSLGFHSIVQKCDESLLDEAIIKYGIIPEFIGRITSIVQLDKFEPKDYKYFLVNDLLPKKQHELGLFFNRSYLEVDEAQLVDMARRASKSGQGIRYLKRELDRICLDLEFNYEKNGAVYLQVEDIEETPEWNITMEK